jgi:ABC-type polysaccharide/polyol phosphate export permease
VKKALFFSFIFPIFLYLVYTAVWGQASVTYARFIMSGILSVTIISNSIMAIGQIIVTYQRTGVSKMLQSIPKAFPIHMFALAFSRIVLISLAYLFLIGLAWIITDFHTSITEFVFGEIGIVTGTLLFSLLGMIVSFLLESRHSENNAANFIFFLFMFVSDAFYPVTEMNPLMSGVVSLNPLTPVLMIIRQQDGAILPYSIWILIAMLSSWLVLKLHNNKR